MLARRTYPGRCKEISGRNCRLGAGLARKRKGRSHTVAEYSRRGGYRGVDGVEIVNYYIDLRVNLSWLTVIEHRDISYSFTR
jgi:hypothetical protein